MQSKNTEQPLESAQVKRCGARILVHGMMACKAFVHHKVSLREAVKVTNNLHNECCIASNCDILNCEQTHVYRVSHKSTIL